MLVSSAFIDLSRHGRAVESLADWASHPVKGGAFENIARQAKNEARVARLVADAAESTPAAFTGASDVQRAVELLRGAQGTLTHVEQTVPDAPRLGKGVRDVSSATNVLRATAADIHEAHRLLGGTRALPELERTASTTLPVPEVAGADHPAVVGKGHQRFQRNVHRAFQLGPAALLGIRTHGASNVPKTGAALIAPNHGTMLDPFIHAYGIDRPVRFIANGKLWNNPRVGRILEAGGAYPVTQGNANAALAVERGVVTTGQLTTHYGEGMLVKGNYVGSHADGLARIALETNTPVVPVGTYGDNKPRMFRGGDRGRHMVEVVYAKPIDFGGMPATPENIGIARERIVRAQEAAVAEAKDLHEARRAASQARRPYWMAGGAITAAAGGATLVGATRD